MYYSALKFFALCNPIINKHKLDMKKFLLLSTLAVAMTANAADYGTSPETAVDFPTTGWFPTAADINQEAWFKIKITTANGRPAAAPSMEITSASYQVFQCADGTMEAPAGPLPNTYGLESGKEYLLKIVPTSDFPIFSFAGTELPESMKGKYECYPIEIPANEMNLYQKQAPGTTVWYKCDFATTSNVSAAYMGMPIMDIEKIVVKHQACPGGINEGSAFMPAYNKAGTNVVGITVASTATADVQFLLSAGGATTTNCAMNLSRAPKLVLDEQNTYPNAYWTVDRVFEAPEDGEYTFINHAAKGSELNIGKAVKGDTDTSSWGFKLSCDFSEGETAIVGDKDAMIVKTLAKGDLVAVQSDVFTKLEEGAPYLKVVKGNATGGINNVGNDNNAVEIVALGGKSFSINNVLLAGGAKVVAYDMNARKVAETAVAAGTESQVITLDVPSGIYLIVVYGANRSASAKVVVE